MRLLITTLLIGCLPYTSFPQPKFDPYARPKINDGFPEPQYIKNYNGFDSSYSVQQSHILNLKGELYSIDDYLGFGIDKYWSYSKKGESKELGVHIYFMVTQNTALIDNQSTILFLLEDGEILKFKQCCTRGTHNYEKDVHTSFFFRPPYNWKLNKSISAIRIITANYQKDYKISYEASDYFIRVLNLLKSMEFSKN